MGNQEIELKPVSMYTITAKLMNHLIVSVKKDLGDKGHDLLKKGIDDFVNEQIEMVVKATKPYELNEEELFNYEKLIDEKQVEQTYKKYIKAQDEAGVEQPVSIYGMMAKVFGHITKAVVDEY